MASPEVPTPDDQAYEVLAFYGEHIGPMPGAHIDQIARVVEAVDDSQMEAKYEYVDPVTGETEMRPVSELFDKDSHGKLKVGLVAGTITGVTAVAIWASVRYTKRRHNG